MARFTTRVELHNAKLETDYETLHKAMEKEGFTRIIPTENGGVKWQVCFCVKFCTTAIYCL